MATNVLIHEHNFTYQDLRTSFIQRLILPDARSNCNSSLRIIFIVMKIMEL